MTNIHPFRHDCFPLFREHLAFGGVLACPTDTIPGFTADPSQKKGVEAIVEAKGRPSEKPFLLLVADYLMAERVCEFSIAARALVNRFWPGPLTLLLPRKQGVLPAFFPQAPELALRVPGNPLLLKFLQFYGKPLTSTSINISGQPPLSDFDAIIERFGSNNNVIIAPDEAQKSYRADTPSTIVRVADGEVRLVRHGKIPEHQISNPQ